MTPLAPNAFLSPLAIEDAVRRALDEDLGRAGDITSTATIPAGTLARAAFVARKAGIVCGLALADMAFRLIDPAVRFDAKVADGDRIAPGNVLATVEGEARAVLAGERVALNFLGHLSGVASATAAYADRIKHTRAKITCTRKTTPGLRALEKYAVKCGGGSNHRFGLDDAVLIKDNHIAVAGGVTAVLARARAAVGHLVRIEIEVDTMDQLKEVLKAGGADVVLLDNMPPAVLRQAVELVGGRLVTEASGGINLETVALVAETGVDFISSGALTHSVTTLDIGLDIAL
ncbi:carboxylating nicotinate-nucleotide diphosphorylase [Blastochloris viridis]|uniref:Probable nicotinate-nucleotide pyrophosphorylase [carboxylating] n=1 Tax=Blastochloris viridis TaxID=1079 RepID=A0A0H5BFX0_BLAVI|nr:carboxylating nicotinate-nucleotide diphosphorylase [Blastochloris viridis]ALK10772.1 putative nicotinate-nucleotide pyrophosphorylase [carboxylating] [Blastochloris viridis]BAR99261.1 quinolinate phosphoribosyltransferase [decarboxylating] [Blastochloris viridis]CUU43434.1 putative nicotinate-nucleotide pyrophosphorylase[carboxylating] [Blastochloris viridis]